jgi:hypothetical protein
MVTLPLGPVSLPQSRNQDQDPSARQRRRHQVQPPEQQFDLRLGRAREHRLLDDLDQPFAHHPGQGSRPQQPHRKPLEGVRRRKVGLHPLLPEVGDHREHGAGMQHHQQQRHLRRRGV